MVLVRFLERYLVGSRLTESHIRKKTLFARFQYRWRSSCQQDLKSAIKNIFDLGAREWGTNKRQDPVKVVWSDFRPKHPNLLNAVGVLICLSFWQDQPQTETRKCWNIFVTGIESKSIPGPKAWPGGSDRGEPGLEAPWRCNSSVYSMGSSDRRTEGREQGPQDAGCKWRHDATYFGEKNDWRIILKICIDRLVLHTEESTIG